jgi:hypothetical protein
MKTFSEIRGHFHSRPRSEPAGRGVEQGPIHGPLAQGDLLNAHGIRASALDGGLAGLSIIHAAAEIDPAVLHAIEFSTAEHLNNLATIDNYVHDHFFDAMSKSAEGWFDRLTGYVAEQKAATVLEQMGHHVEFAPVANQPVWDLMVDGEYVQIKTGLAGVKDFLAAHHGMDVYTSPEIAAAVKDPLVHGLPELSAIHIDGATQHTLDGVKDSLHPGLHFPIITFAFSAYREFNLIQDQQKELGLAIQHLTMDVGGVAVGGLAGAKLGALAGAVFGPMGITVGGFVGAIGGAISCKMTATSLRCADFKKALTSYNNAIYETKIKIADAIASSRTQIHGAQGELQERFVAIRNGIEKRTRSEIGKIEADFEADVRRLFDRFPHFLDELADQLNCEEARVLAAIPCSGVWGFLFPREEDHLREAVKVWFGRAREIVQSEEIQFCKMQTQTPEAILGEVQRFLEEYVFQLESLEAELLEVTESFRESTDLARALKEKAVREAEQSRSKLIREFGNRVETIHLAIVEMIDKSNKLLSKCKDVATREGNLVGEQLSF